MSGALISVFANQRQFATVPGAPTIGTATVLGVTRATVSYTAPASNGGAEITSYTATSSPGGITGTISQSGSGTITVSGLSGATSYTFTVTATNAVGTSAASAASNSITTLTAPTTIGQSYGGGYYAGQIGVGGVATHYLVVGPVASAQSNKQWKTNNTSTSGTSSVIDGPTNSSFMNNAQHPAGEFCETLTTGGFSDWYMPAKNELEVCYYFLKPTTASNITTGGSNANAVSPEPISTNYTAGSPAQTSVAAFQSGGAESFDAVIYWSSTQRTPAGAYAWQQSFNVGSQYSYFVNKTQSYNVRAIRRVGI